MILYVPSDFRRVLCEAFCPATDPPWLRSGALAVLPLRRHGPVGTSDGSPTATDKRETPPSQSLGPGTLDYSWPASPVHDEDTWPETWTAVPALCSVCDSPAIPDRTSTAPRPGWRCTADPSHTGRCASTPCGATWQFTPAPHLPLVRHPRGRTPAWLEAHYHPPRLSAGPLATPVPGF